MGVTDNLFLPAIDEIVKAYVGKWGIEKVCELTGEYPSSNTDDIVKLKRKVKELQEEIDDMLSD